MSFDIHTMRACYPALADGFAYLDGAAGTQVPTAVIEAIAAAYQSGIGNTDGEFPASRRSAEIEQSCRAAIADLVGGTADGVVLGPNMTTLTYRFATTLATRWREGDEVIVSQLDHDANVRPWVQAAARVGARVRWATVEPGSGVLGAEQYRSLVTGRTRLVAVSAASNLIGSRPDVAAIAEAAHDAGALTYVDGVHATAHFATDVRALGADFYVTSAYKWSGPHVGALVADPALLGELHPDKLAPATDDVPYRFERGTLPFADLAGVAAAVDHLASFGGTSGTRRDRLVEAMAGIERHEQDLFATMLAGLSDIRDVTAYCTCSSRAPTAFFNVGDRDPRGVAAALAEGGVNVWSGDNYAYELVNALGLRGRGGGVRAGIVHYNDSADVNRLLEGVTSLASSPRGA